MTRLARLAALIVTVVSSASLAACGGGGDTGTSGSAPSGGGDLGPLIADSGFRPATDGFAFPNYGNEKNYTNLTPVEMRAMFGDQVCVNPGGSTCDLIPTAQAYMDAENQGMAGGHCQGFAATAMLIYRGVVKPSDLGGTKGASSIPVDGNDRIQRRIALSFEYQTFDSVNSQLVLAPPAEIVAKLKDYFQNPGGEAYVLSIRKRDNTGGHAITPFALKDLGGGKVSILVYDNNYPGEVRHVDIDTTANTWQYNAAINPSVPPELYEGDATTLTMRLRPTLPALKQQPCPVCAAAQTAAYLNSATTLDTAGTDFVILDGNATSHAHLLITDDAGHRLGYDHGTLLSEIPGAKVVTEDLIDDSTESLEPVYEIPSSLKVSVTVDGSALAAADTESVTLTGPTRDLVIDQLNVQPGTRDVLTFSSDRSALTLQSGGAESPKFDLGDDGSTDYAFTVTANGMTVGSTVGMSLEDTGFVIDTTAAGGDISADLAFERLSSGGDVAFKHTGVSLPKGGKTTIDYTTYTARGQSVKATTEGGASQELADQG